MRFSGAKLFLISILALAAPIANANIFRIDLTFTDQDTPPTGTLSGFIVIDETLFDGQQNRTSGNSIPMPDWISQASLTLEPAGGGSNVTVTSFGRLDWNVGSGVNYDASSNFLSQITRFGLRDFGDFNGSSTSSPLVQQYDEGEFLLSSASAPEAAPGPLPILGLLTFAWYFRKFKNKN